MYVKEIIVRKKKKKRVKNVKKLMKQNIFIFNHLLTSIENFEITWKTIDFIWLIEKTKKKKIMRQRERTVMSASTEDEKDEKNETNEVNETNETDAQRTDEEEMQFVIDTNSNQWLDQDFIEFDDDENQKHVRWMSY